MIMERLLGRPGQRIPSRAEMQRLSIGFVPLKLFQAFDRLVVLLAP
jgi:hypothetical protein